MYRAPDFKTAVAMADRLVMLFGAGHTSVLYSNTLNRPHIDYFINTMKTVRTLVNTPASQGAIGDLYNFHLVGKALCSCLPGRLSPCMLASLSFTRQAAWPLPLACPPKCPVSV